MAGQPWRALLALLVGCVVLTGCAGLEAPAVAGPDAVPPRRPPNQPPSAYQDRLTQLDQELGAALTRVREAHDPQALEQATLAIASVSSAAGERMRVDPGDPGVIRANTALANSLDQFGRELAFLSQRVHEHEVCTGPAAVDMIATAPTMPALRAVSRGLALPGENGRTYRWGGSLPPTRDDLSSPPPAPVNGAILVDHRTPGQGEGVLEARNEGTDAAVVFLARAGSALVVSVAVSSGQTAVVGGIPDGDYELAYTSGRDWDAADNGAFSRGCQFRRFTAPAPFRTEPMAGGTGYTVRTVVIRSGPADAATADIPARQLPG
ncbi:MAG: hypothetical protein M3Z25_16930 [Actinomycetota bacterium]|nr:hypothetical protein [Actinomycetota bacterium]